MYFVVESIVSEAWIINPQSYYTRNSPRTQFAIYMCVGKLNARIDIYTVGKPLEIGELWVSHNRNFPIDKF